MGEIATGTVSAELEDRDAGVEFDAPRLIPGVRAQLSEIESREGPDQGSLTAFQDGVGTLVHAMKADLLSDSVLRAVAGGTGDSAQIERLIGIYEERMRKAVN